MHNAWALRSTPKGFTKTVLKLCADFLWCFPLIARVGPWRNGDASLCNNPKLHKFSMLFHATMRRCGALQGRPPCFLSVYMFSVLIRIKRRMSWARTHFAVSPNPVHRLYLRAKFSCANERGWCVRTSAGNVCEYSSCWNWARKSLKSLGAPRVLNKNSLSPHAASVQYRGAKPSGLWRRWCAGATLCYSNMLHNTANDSPSAHNCIIALQHPLSVHRQQRVSFIVICFRCACLNICVCAQTLLGSVLSALWITPVVCGGIRVYINRVPWEKQTGRGAVKETTGDQEVVCFVCAGHDHSET